MRDQDGVARSVLIELVFVCFSFFFFRVTRANGAKRVEVSERAENGAPLRQREDKKRE